jgi:hypothetical protein
MESQGIKETKEVVIGAMVIGGMVVGKLKDGFQLEDITALFSEIMSDPVKKAKLQAAVMDAEKSPKEIQDLSYSEGLELLIAVAQELPSIIGKK